MSRLLSPTTRAARDSSLQELLLFSDLLRTQDEDNFRRQMQAELQDAELAQLQQRPPAPPAVTRTGLGRLTPEESAQQSQQQQVRQAVARGAFQVPGTETLIPLSPEAREFAGLSLLDENVARVQAQTAPLAGQREQRKIIQQSYAKDRNRVAEFIANPRNGVTEDQAAEIWGQLNDSYARRGLVNDLPAPPDLVSTLTREDDPAVRLTEDRESAKLDPDYVEGSENRLYTDPRTGKTNWSDFDRAKEANIRRKKQEAEHNQALYKSQIESLDVRRKLLTEDLKAGVVDNNEFREGVLALENERQVLTRKAFGIAEPTAESAPEDVTTEQAISGPIVPVESPEQFLSKVRSGEFKSGQKVLLWNGQIRTVK